MRTHFLLPVAIALAGCAGPERLPADVEAASLLGETLRAPALEGERREALDARLAAAKRAFVADPRSFEALTELGLCYEERREFRTALHVWTAALERYPDDASFHRRRGETYLRLRRLDSAAFDLERAARLVAGAADAPEDGGSRRAAVHLLLGIVRHVRGDDGEAVVALRRARDVAADTGDGRREAQARAWLATALTRAGRRAEVEVESPDAAAGALVDDPAWRSYAEGVERAARGDAAGAEASFEAAREAGPWWSLGAVAAEAALARGRSSGAPISRLFRSTA